MSHHGNSHQRLRILAISQDFSRRGPSGWALLQVLNQLADRHDIRCIGGAMRPAAMHPLITYHKAWRFRSAGQFPAFLTFHVSHFAVWVWLRVARAIRFDVVQTLDAESLLGTVVTFHFCDEAYLQQAKRHGLFCVENWLGKMAVRHEVVHRRLRAWVERRVCRSSRTKVLIAVSRHLAEDIEKYCQPRLRPLVIANPLPK